MKPLLPLLFLLLALASYSALAQDQTRESTQLQCGTPLVKQDFYLVANATEHARIATIGAGPCVVLTIHEPLSQTAVMAHVAASIDVKKALQEITKDLNKRGLKGRRLEARLIGGWEKWSNAIVDNLVLELDRNRITLVEMEVLQDIGYGPHDNYLPDTHLPQDAIIKNLEINTKSGEIKTLELRGLPEAIDCTNMLPAPQPSFVRMPRL